MHRCLNRRAPSWIYTVLRRYLERWRPTDERPEILRTRLTWHPAGSATPLDAPLAELFATARID